MQYYTKRGSNVLFLSSATLLVLLLASFLVTRRALHPATVFSAIWTIQLIGVAVLYDRFLPVSELALFIVTAGALVFCVAATVDISKQPQSRSGHFTPPASQWLITTKLPVYVLAATLATLALAAQVNIFLNVGGGESLALTLVSVRLKLSLDNDDVYGLFKYGNSLAFAAMICLAILVAQRRGTLKHRALLFLFVFFNLAFAGLSTGRGPIALVVLILCIVYLLTSQTEQFWRRFLVAALLLAGFVLMVFWSMGALMGKADEQFGAAVLGFLDYLFSSVPALSVYLRHNNVDLLGGDGQNTLRIFMAIAAKLNVAATSTSLVQADVAVPHLTNLYTIYLPFLQDFGFLAYLAPIAAIGWGQGYLYRRYQQRQADCALFLLSVSYLPLLQSVFQELYFSNISTWAQLSLLLLLFARPQKRALAQTYVAC